MGCGSSKSTETKTTDKSRPGALTAKQERVIAKQQAKSLCQITANELKLTGFLCNIPEPVLITNNHVLNDSQLKLGKEIRIYFTDINAKKHYNKKNYYR